MGATQRDSILHHLKKGKSITSLSAFYLFDSLSLASQIYSLRKSGFNVQGEFIRTSSGKYVKKYFLMK